MRACGGVCGFVFGWNAYMHIVISIYFQKQTKSEVGENM